MKSEKWGRGKGCGAPSARGRAVARCQGYKKMLVVREVDAAAKPGFGAGARNARKGRTVRNGSSEYKLPFRHRAGVEKNVGAREVDAAVNPDFGAGARNARNGRNVICGSTRG